MLVETLIFSVIAFALFVYIFYRTFHKDPGESLILPDLYDYTYLSCIFSIPHMEWIQNTGLR